MGTPLSASPQRTASAEPSPPAVRPVAAAPLSRAPVASSSNWTAQGGTPIVIAQGETANVLADRYGVPLDALVRTNGYSSASEIRPGARLLVPVYSVNTGHTATAAVPAAAKAKPVQVAETAPARKETMKLVKGPEPIKAARPTAADDAPASKKAQPSAKAKLLERTKTARAKTEDADDAPALKKPATVKADKAADRAKVARAKTDDDDDAAPAKKSPAIGKAKLLERTKVAHVKADEDDHVVPQKTVATPARRTAMREETPKPAAKVAVAEPVKTAPVKIAREEAPKPEKITAPKVAQADRPIDKKPAIDPSPTASLSPVESAKADKPAEKSADAGNADFRWPARGRVIQGFKSNGNDGINIAVPEGTPVKAAEDGVVAYSGSELKGYGNLVLIRHPNGFVSAYANNGSLDVKRGDAVKRGQTIAKSGQSGNVTSPQIHFELRKGAQPVDPATYLAGN